MLINEDGTIEKHFTELYVQIRVQLTYFYDENHIFRDAISREYASTMVRLYSMCFVQAISVHVAKDLLLLTFKVATLWSLGQTTLSTSTLM